ncbi:YdeI/OmpD-associated family protein [Fulvivirga maritima]|uniref:YdeI/OmpD-associated family protein n=1 Tax=Fulvivirga maritima TaxID=2904247 RepID=UPI001F4719DB|nr:YdeI/OmpD-associated family protein [Fulvivirga maritima]UII24634.1 YdeI/OmpD-associated family protein [Fulvivirga maritima]
MPSFKSTIGKLDQLKLKYLEIPKKIVDEMGGLKQRVVVKVNDVISYQSGFMALGEGKAYITINNERLKKIKADVGSTVHVTLKPDTSKYGMPFPEELEELLKQDDEGKRRFDLLPISKQRYIIYHVAQAKRSQTRIDRSIMLIENLKQLPEGNEEFRRILGKD